MLLESKLIDERRVPKRLVTFDIDGTICHSPAMAANQWQRLREDPTAERNFYENLPLAHPDLPGFIQWLQTVHNMEVGFVTARSMWDRDITMEYLNRHGIHPTWLVVNMPAEERGVFLQSINACVHFDDHDLVQQTFERTIPVWYNDWGKVPSPKYYTWEEINRITGYGTTANYPLQLSLFTPELVTF